MIAKSCFPKLRISQASIVNAHKIMECTNDAFMADAFFKKEEFHQRFTLDDVHQLITRHNSGFLVATAPICVSPIENTDDKEDIVGSIHFEWEVEEEAKVLTGHFSAVAVPSKYGGRGIGKALVGAVESKLIELAQEYRTERQLPIQRVVSSMGVLNVRPDLFPWYQQQGYTQSYRLPDTPELARIKLDDAADVHCILFEKVLVCE